MQERGVLIAFEGIDGSGKTTQAAKLLERLKAAVIPYRASKEPTNQTWGRKIRESKTKGRMSPELELQAFLNDRRQHVAEVIDPELAAGRVVVIDRYYYSTVAYQGARGLDPADLLRRNEEFAPRPDLVVILDVPPRVGLERIAGRGDTADLFEREDNLAKAREIFLGLEGDHILRLDGTRPADELHLEILGRLQEGPLASRYAEMRRDVYGVPADGEEPLSVTDRTLLARAKELAHDASVPLSDKAVTFLKAIR